MADWTKSPDLLAAVLLSIAFAAVARHQPTRFSRLWLAAWALISMHFAATIFCASDGMLGNLTNFLSMSTLAMAGNTFLWSLLEDDDEPFLPSRYATCIGVCLLFTGLLSFAPQAEWTIRIAALLFIVFPMTRFLVGRHHCRTLPFFASIFLQSIMVVFMLAVSNHPGANELRANALLFALYFNCAVLFLIALKRPSTGALVTTAGFFAWASVFLIAPLMAAFRPDTHLESELWNLPKYVVAVGMILLTLEKQVEHNKYLALHDELTGLPNRRLFQDRLTRALDRSRRTGASTALMVIDMNHFKQVNDTLGHHAGDLLLQHVAQIFEGRIRKTDTVARTGGDEFSIILEEPITREEAQRVSHELLELLHEPFLLLNEAIASDASIGLALFPQDAPDQESLCIAADLRMYAVKRHSRKRHEPAIAPAITHSVLPARGEEGEHPGLVC